MRSSRLRILAAGKRKLIGLAKRRNRHIEAPGEHAGARCGKNLPAYAMKEEVGATIWSSSSPLALSISDAPYS